MFEPKARTLDKIQFTNHTREEVILWLQKNAKKNPSFSRLAKWIAESAEFEKSHYAVRLAIANAERTAERKAHDVTKEDFDLIPWSQIRKS